MSGIFTIDTDFNDPKNKGISNAILMDRVIQEYNIAASVTYKGFKQQNNLLRYSDILLRHNARGIQVPLPLRPHGPIPAVLAQAAVLAAQGVAAVPAVLAQDAQPAWRGGNKWLAELPTAATMFPGVRPQDITIAQTEQIKQARDEALARTEFDQIAKKELFRVLPRIAMDHFSKSRFAIGVIHYSDMVSTEL